LCVKKLQQLPERAMGSSFSKRRRAADEKEKEQKTCSEEAVNGYKTTEDDETKDELSRQLTISSAIMPGASRLRITRGRSNLAKAASDLSMAIVFTLQLALH